MPKVTKKQAPSAKTIQISVDQNTVVTIQYDGETAKAILNNNVISQAGGSWLQWCFYVEDYQICIDRGELEG